MMTKRKQRIIDQVLIEILKDIKKRDVTAVEELLSLIPEKNLLQYLPEDYTPGAVDPLNLQSPSPWDEEEIKKNGSPFDIYL